MTRGDFSNRLVGKFFTNSTPPSLQKTKTSLRQQWRQNILPKNMNITLHKQDNGCCYFLFDFKQKKDTEFVLSNGAWVVNGVTLVIKKYTSSKLNEIDFTVSEISIKVKGLPLYYLTKQVFSYIQTLLTNNKPLVIAEPSNRELCFKTEIDLKKPLNPGFYLDETRFVEFTYKNIGDFCYNCGMMNHIQSNCNQKSPKERSLNATSKTPVYGPWLRLNDSFKDYTCYENDLKLSYEEKQEDVKECEKTLLYRQFFLQLKFNVKLVCNSDSKLLPLATHNFRFPCSYLDDDSKACEVIAKEISEITRLPLKFFEQLPLNWPIKEINGEKSKLNYSLLKHLNVIREKTEDKWLPIKLEINLIFTQKHVYYHRIVNRFEDNHCVKEIESKISKLIKKKVEKKEDLSSLFLWESDIRKALMEIGYDNYPYLFDVSTRAQEAMEETSEIATKCLISAERSSVEKLERRKVIGSEIDRLDPCVICSEEMFLAEEVTVLPCLHVFHRLCVHKWFQVGHKCPLCGFELPLQE